MEELAERFIEEREAQGLRGPGRRVPVELRAMAVRYARWASEGHGEGASQVARRLRVSPATLERWLAAAGDAPAAVMREVVVRDAPEARAEVSAPGLALVTPDGFRVEGLGGAELIELLRALRA